MPKHPRIRCAECNRILSLPARFYCRFCGRTLCAAHRFSDAHNDKVCAEVERATWHPKEPDHPRKERVDWSARASESGTTGAY